jgi:hypothetical protein
MDFIVSNHAFEDFQSEYYCGSGSIFARDELDESFLREKFLPSPSSKIYSESKEENDRRRRFLDDTGSVLRWER